MTLQLVCTYEHYAFNNINTVGQPVGWCITDREVIKLFLGKIKSQLPESQVLVIMTDDGELTTTAT